MPVTLDVPPNTYPAAGLTQEAFLYAQCVILANAINGISGLSTNNPNTFTALQTYSAPAIFNNTLTTTVQEVNLIDNNNATGVDYPVALGHTNSGGVGGAGLGVGINLTVESATEGVRGSIATFEAQQTVATAGAQTGEAGINVTNAGASRREVTFAKNQTRWLNTPQATANFGAIFLGDGGYTGPGGQNFAGNANGTWYSGNADGAFAGDLLRLQTGGKDRLVVPAAGGVIIDASNSYAGNLLEVRKNSVAVFSISNSGAIAQSSLLGQITDTGTNTAPLTLRLAHFLSSGTAVANFGTGMEFFGQDSAGTQLQTANITCFETTLTPGGVGSALVFSNRQSGSTVECMRFTGGGFCQITGTLAHVGTGFGAFAVTPTTQQATASAAGITGIRTDTLANAVTDIRVVLTALRSWAVQYGLTAATA